MKTKRTMTTRVPSRGRLAAALQPFIDKRWVAGAVMLVADRDRVLTVETAGFADIAAGKRMRPDTLFWIASQTKPMTASVLMMLVDERKVRLDDPVEAYLPEFKGQWLCVKQDAARMLLKKPRHPITVRNLLSHTSGVPHTSPMETPTFDLLPLRDAVRSYAMVPLQFQPDTRYSYSNGGFNTAGRIIEVVSGMPYEEFLDRRLLGPLGMKDTTFWPGKRQVARLAKSYKPDAHKRGLEETTIAQLRYPLCDRARRPLPAGGLFSTAGDVARFCGMILNGGVYEGTKYLSKAAVRQMTRRQTAEGIPESYGLGWTVSEDCFGHGGAQKTNMTIYPARGLVLVYLVQHAGFAGDGAKGIEVFKETALEDFGR